MDPAEFNTVEKIAQYTKDTVKIYRHYPAQKAAVVEKLAPLFAEEVEGWKVVTELGKFRNGFTRVLGVKGMRALKMLLYDLDKAKYQHVDFGLDD